MRTLHPRWAAATMLLALACSEHESPTAATLRRSAPPRATTDILNPPCTVRWASGVNGNWTDGTKWNPVGIPGATSSVCIDAAGAYIVTLDPTVDATPVDIVSLDVGAAGATPTLRLTGTDVTLNVAQGIVIQSGATMDVRAFTAGVVNATGGVMNLGTLAFVALCGNCGSGNVLNADVDNRGTFSNQTTLVLGKVNGNHVNSGVISMLSLGTITIPASTGNPVFAQNAGEISSPNTANSARLAMEAGTFNMNGGRTGERSTVNVLPIVVLDGASLVIGAGATDVSTLAIRARSTSTPTVTGDIPAQMTLRMAGSADGQPGGIAFTGNVANRGTIIPLRFMDGVGALLTLAGTGRLTNDGTIDHTPNGGGAGVVTYAVEVTNNATLTLQSSNALFSKPSGTYVNNGLIDMGSNSSTHTLTVLGATLQNTASATVTGGFFRIDGGRVLSHGPVLSKVIAENGGVLEPGLSTAILDVYAFTPAASGILRVELGGPVPGAQYDRLNATAAAVFDGQLDIVATNGFQAGLCGQVFDVLTHTFGNSTGTFDVISGLNPAPNRSLRVYHDIVLGGTSRLRLIGIDPTASICAGPAALSVTEGGASVQYAVTLDHAPTALVTVTAAPDAQVMVTPAALSFTASNWQLPQYFTVSAVDDAVVEGTHLGTVTHAVNTSDMSYFGFVPNSVVASITDNDAPANLPPVASFTQTCTPQSCLLNASSSTDDNGIVTYLWSAGTSGRPNASGVTVNRKRAVSGYPNTWQETLTVTDAQGLSHSVTQTVTIPPVGVDLPPVADFTITCTSAPRRCVLDGSPSTDDTGIVSWSWSAGTSGRPAATGQNIKRAYSVHYPNTWQETLTVTDQSGQTSSITKTVTVP